MSKKILVTRPEHDRTTYYLSLWSKKVLEKFERANDIIHLEKKRDSKDNFTSYLKSNEIDILFLNGHGDEISVCGNAHDEIILKKGENEDVTRNTKMYVRSCDAGKKLGKSCVKNGGAKAFIGYDSEFMFWTDKKKQAKPLEDKLAKPVLEASNKAIGTLIKTNNADESYNVSQKEYKEKIDEVLSDPYYSLAKYQIFAALVHNKNAQVIHKK